MNTQVRESDLALLISLYRNRTVFHGELHDHAATGGTSDGACSLDVWKKEMAEQKLDFAAILDHRQVRHMYLPAWDDTLFVSGTEPGTVISDSKAQRAELHYNMIVPEAKVLEEILSEFPEYAFTGGPEGHFTYPYFTRERFGALADAVRAHGGFFVLPHPKQITVSDDPLDYWFRDETGIEAVYRSLDSEDTKEDTALWFDLLRLGKRVWACAGGDEHSHPHNTAVTTIYAEEQNGKAYLPHLRCGDFTCGSAGIRMCVGDTVMGGLCGFSGKRLVIAAGDFHDSVVIPGHTYRLDVLNDKETVCSVPVSPETVSFLALDADPAAAFLRVEIWDETKDLRIALGNPIWNSETR